MFIGLDVSPVKGRFVVPKSVVELERAVRLVALMGFVDAYKVRSVFDLSFVLSNKATSNAAAASQPDPCTLLDALTAQTVGGNINGR